MQLANCIWVAIVKDEIDNLAGGIIITCERILPHVGGALVLDTGSTDGTIEALQDLQKKYDHLNIEQMTVPFTSFADARNRSLEFASTRGFEIAVILDADEELSDTSWENLSTALGNSPEIPKCICFDIETCDEHGEPLHRSNSGMLNPRCFPLMPELRFVDQVGARFERLMFDGEALPREWMVRDADVKMLHYIPGQQARKRKTKKYREEF